MNIYVLYTGGTIGCWETSDGLAPMPWETFRSAFQKKLEGIIKEEHNGINLIYDGFIEPLDSTNMQPRQWVEIADKIIDNYLDCDGFLILHGTDTMAYTSSALSFLLPQITKPIIVTGSQLPLFKAVKSKKPNISKFEFEYNTDALRNILGSISFLTQGMPEVCLFFADKLFRGNRAVKSNANGFVAFESPNFPALGEYGITPKLNKNLVLPIDFSGEYDMEINNIRNKFAHSVLEKDEAGREYFRYGDSGLTFDVAFCKTIRKNILKHKKNLDELNEQVSKR